MTKGGHRLFLFHDYYSRELAYLLYHKNFHYVAIFFEHQILGPLKKNKNKSSRSNSNLWPWIWDGTHHSAANQESFPRWSMTAEYKQGSNPLILTCREHPGLSMMWTRVLWQRVVRNVFPNGDIRAHIQISLGIPKALPPRM